MNTFANDFGLRKGLLGIAMASLVGGCATMAGEGPRASAQLSPTRGNSASGNVSFVQRGGTVVMAAAIAGLKPNGEHGFHVHDKGDCSSGDGMSAGGHFNPFGKGHGAHPSLERHAGDMPNLKADAGGHAKVTVELNILTVADGPASVVGRAVIVHVQPDDYRSQPVGNAGARIACGVIQRS